MNKEMINTNKAVVVRFDAYASQLQITNTASAYIYMFRFWSEKSMSEGLILIFWQILNRYILRLVWLKMVRWALVMLVYYVIQV